ncbi:hypothetical protein GCM10023205_45990 [Yinghuangia aomiensis]|uniref:Uncharacterized protein n=1 Tax=Yinghuangia aomiensis TaxID=676205 RepID=A0ABP9HN65_9ACTN
MLVVFTPGLHRFDYYRLLERVNRGEATVQDIKDSSQRTARRRTTNHYFASPVWRQAFAGSRAS